MSEDFDGRPGWMYKHYLDPESEDPQKIYNRRAMTFGVYGHAGSGFNTFSDRLIERINIPYIFQFPARDTLFTRDEKKGKGQFADNWPWLGLYP